MIRDFEPRLYQEAIFSTCAAKNTLVVLPTGLGKTNIFLMVAGHRLSQYPGSKVLLVGPTRPLIEQYCEVFRRHLDIPEGSMCVLTGMVPPVKRAALWESSRVIFSTPQGLENDIITRRIGLEEVSLLGIDEAHRAVGDYSYVWVAEQYHKSAVNPRIVGLTASPGSDTEGISQVCRNLFIEEIESRSYSDPDVAQYIQEIEVAWRPVTLPQEMVEVKALLDSCLRRRTERLEKWHLARSKSQSKKELLMMQAGIQARIARGEKDFFLWTAISVIAEAIKISHASELLETQGISVLVKYFDKLDLEFSRNKSKAAKSLQADADFQLAKQKAKDLFGRGIEHPKLKELADLAGEELGGSSEAKLMVFTQYRDSAVRICSELNSIEGLHARIFVGQAKKGDTGMSQKEQKAILDEFRQGIFNVLVATSIGEEGLDIPRVDTVVFYEPIPSAIRFIQRRGRTGRHGKGKVFVLLAKGTRDEAFRWVAHHKEKSMHRSIKRLKGTLSVGDRSSVKVADEGVDLQKYVQRPKIFVDAREQGNQVVKHLSSDAEIVMQRLEAADYIVSSRVGVEVKKVSDFVDSIIDGRLLAQARELRKCFERPLLIIEGEESLFSQRNVHPNAVRGMLATLAVSYGIPLLNSRSSLDTAALVLAVARKEQEGGVNSYTPHKGKPASVSQQQEYIVSSFPSIGKSLAKPLLRRFRTVRNIVNASEQELREVDLIGEKKARDIRGVIDAEYSED
ncbi:DEAD/DEAH box helicase [Candidatus Woesearchaeota archaeon]|nr:DEAD/DEAH box helicase [Candidatus Woesearchaeota archaeon]